MPKVYYLAGVPASGKSSILRELIKRLIQIDPESFQHGKLHGIKGQGVAVYGIYDGGKFDGTDRLSMTVIDDAIDYYKNEAEPSGVKVIIVEGDRLLCRRFLDSVRARIIVIDAEPRELMRRHIQRGDTQESAFLKRCRTKVNNICTAYGVKKYMNNTMADAERLVNAIERDIKKTINGKEVL